MEGFSFCKSQFATTMKVTAQGHVSSALVLKQKHLLLQMAVEMDQSASKFAYSAASGLVLAAEIDASLLSKTDVTHSLEKTIGLLTSLWEDQER